MGARSAARTQAPCGCHQCRSPAWHPGQAGACASSRHGRRKRASVPTDQIQGGPNAGRPWVPGAPPTLGPTGQPSRSSFSTSSCARGCSALCSAQRSALDVPSTLADWIVRMAAPRDSRREETQPVPPSGEPRYSRCLLGAACVRSLAPADPRASRGRQMPSRARTSASLSAARTFCAPRPVPSSLGRPLGS